MSPDLLDLRWAYFVLGAEHTATPVTLRHLYKALVKEWHPDRYANDPVKLEEANRKIRDINSAYDMVKTAPLRYHISEHPRVVARAEKRAARPSGRPRAYEPVPQYARFDWREEMIIRFIFGIIGGALFCFFASMKMHRMDVPLWVWCAITLFLGWGNTRRGNSFWLRLMEFWRW